MPHLSFDHDAGLADLVDMTGLCAALRDALADSGHFPLGGIRVRGHAVDSHAIADGAAGRHFLDMVLRIGPGRGDAVHAQVLDAIYETARHHIEPRLGDATIALSLELREFDPARQRKGWNTIHATLAQEAKSP